MEKKYRKREEKTEPKADVLERRTLSHAGLRAALYEKQERWVLHARKTSIHSVRPCAQERSQARRGRTAVDGRRRRHRGAFEVHLHIHWFILFRYRAAAARPGAVTRSVRKIAPLRPLSPLYRRYVVANLKALAI